MAKQMIYEQFRRMQKLAGLINENSWVRFSCLEFDMIIPYNDVPKFDYPEEAKKYFKKEFNGVYEVSEAQDGWYVKLSLDGGMDI